MAKRLNRAQEQLFEALVVARCVGEVEMVYVSQAFMDKLVPVMRGYRPSRGRFLSVPLRVKEMDEDWEFVWSSA